MKGTRVVYALTDQSGLVTGELQEISKDSLIIDSKSISLVDLERFGRRKKGSGFWTFISSFVGGAMIGTVLAPEPDPCPSCQAVIVEDSGGTIGDVLLIAGGASLTAVGINTGIKNSPKDLSSGKWVLEIVN
ncbi:MAG: hypothetical protein WA960_14995 [Tunicatimonas sp.]